MKVVVKAWGVENWLANTERYCCKEMLINAGYYCSTHYHKIKDETFILRSGSVGLMIDGVAYTMKIDEPYRIKPGQKHFFKAFTDSVIIEASTHHDDRDSYRDNQSGRFST